ncbi:exosome complex component RRP46-like [Dendronephthya gigantea]|uniref:exosome complex component RRP46-like n=1 Tax=Dendronephthya gigantea TaxID=151771 RepID=UPI0010694AE4|nr:exosome complex component RRP46-like [Dendronephthya gigantea]
MAEEVQNLVAQNFVNLRCFGCELGLLNNTDGSALFSHGNTSVMVGVYGPAEVRFNKEIVDKATVEVVFRPKTGIPGCAEKAMERLIRNTCDSTIITTLHPRSAMTIVVQEVCNDGSLLSCCINGACMGMLNAGFPMKYLVAAITTAILKDGEICTDPKAKQEQEAKAVLTFAFESVNKEVVLSSTKGVFTVQQYERCLLVSCDCAQNIFNFYKTSITRLLSKDVKFMDLNIAKKSIDADELG